MAFVAFNECLHVFQSGNCQKSSHSNRESNSYYPLFIALLFEQETVDLFDVNAVLAKLKM